MIVPGSDIITRDDRILITGATGFIGAKLVANLLERDFRNLRCFARPSSNTSELEAVARRYSDAKVEIIKGNLLSRSDCGNAVDGVKVIYHLAAGTSQSYFADAFMNSVVTTRNLLDAAHQSGNLRRFVNISSFAVYGEMRRRGRVLDESCAIDQQPELRGEAYCFAKIRQEQLVRDFCISHGTPYVIVRPGYVFGPGKQIHTGRVGIDTFGVYLHLGGSNPMPFTYVDNCADAIVLSGLRDGVDGEIFNVVDDNLPSSRQYLRLYKKNVKRFTSIYIPHWLSYLLCYLWERYSAVSQEQLPPVFNRKRWHAYWKKTRYSNEKLKSQLGWAPHVTMAEGLTRYFESCRSVHHA